MLLLQVNLSPVSKATKDAVQMKRLIGDGAVQSSRTRHHLPHRTPDRTVRTHNAADSWV